ncbi:hypothetical protein ONZ45_g12100 [Pleurotus djamor]|nr:hypothetical protein ONZ45_g12100 [Pleurotus djamor]
MGEESTFEEGEREEEEEEREMLDEEEGDVERTEGESNGSKPLPFPPKCPFPPFKPRSDRNHELEGVEYGESSRLWLIGKVNARGVGEMVDRAGVQREGEGDSVVFTERFHASKQSWVEVVDYCVDPQISSG